MFGIFGSAAKKTAQALDIIEEDQPTVEEVAEAAEILSEQPIALMPTPQKVGLVEPIIIDPQVIFERLTELFGVYKGTSKTYNLECDECYHGWEEESAPSDWEDDVECPHCGHEHEFSEAYTYTSVEQLTSRTPTNSELLAVDAYERQIFCRYETSLSELKTLFIALSGNTPLDEDGDEFDYNTGPLLFKYRNIKSLAEVTQPVEVTADDDDLEDFEHVI